MYSGSEPRERICALRSSTPIGLICRDQPQSNSTLPCAHTMRYADTGSHSRSELLANTPEALINPQSSPPNGILVKRPLLVADYFVLIGFKAPEREGRLNGGISG